MAKEHLGPLKTVEQKVNEAIERADKRFRSTVHGENLRELWPLMTEHFGEPKDIEIITHSQTYKVTFPDGRIYKVHVWTIPGRDFHEFVYEKGSMVPKPVKTIKVKSGKCWKVVEWIDGVCDRISIYDPTNLRLIPPKRWHALGRLLGEISSHRPVAKEMMMTVCDLHWGNFAAVGDKVALIDDKKITADHVPEKWAFYYILFNQYHLPEQMNAFIEGYVSAVKGPRSEAEMGMLKTAETFLRRLREKLERER